MLRVVTFALSLVWVCAEECQTQGGERLILAGLVFDKAAVDKVVHELQSKLDVKQESSTSGGLQLGQHVATTMVEMYTVAAVSQTLALQHKDLTEVISVIKEVKDAMPALVSDMGKASSTMTTVWNKLHNAAGKVNKVMRSTVGTNSMRAKVNPQTHKLQMDKISMPDKPSSNIAELKEYVDKFDSVDLEQQVLQVKVHAQKVAQQTALLSAVSLAGSVTNLAQVVWHLLESMDQESQHKQVVSVKRWHKELKEFKSELVSIFQQAEDKQGMPNLNRVNWVNLRLTKTNGEVQQFFGDVKARMDTAKSNRFNSAMSFTGNIFHVGQAFFQASQLQCLGVDLLLGQLLYGGAAVADFAAIVAASFDVSTLLKTVHTATELAETSNEYTLAMESILHLLNTNFEEDADTVAALTGVAIAMAEPVHLVDGLA